MERQKPDIRDRSVEDDMMVEFFSNNLCVFITRLDRDVRFIIENEAFLLRAGTTLGDISFFSATDVSKIKSAVLVSGLWGLEDFFMFLDEVNLGESTDIYPEFLSGATNEEMVNFLGRLGFRRGANLGDADKIPVIGRTDEVREKFMSLLKRIDVRAKLEQRAARLIEPRP